MGKTYRQLTPLCSRAVKNGTLKIEYCPTSDMIACMMTKGLNREQFVKQRTNAGLCKLPLKSSEEKCWSSSVHFRLGVVRVMCVVTHLVVA